MPAPRRIVFVCTEDWFFASHFLPMARAARALGHEVAVVARVRDHRAAIEAAGARVVPLEAERSSLNPMRTGYAAGQLAGILGALRADLVHCVALRGILVGGAAAAMAGVRRRVLAPTGLGLVGARDDGLARLARRGLAIGLRALATPATRLLFENLDDPRRLGFDPADPRVTILGGAGIDLDAWVPAPLPPGPPLRAALVARMVWSKGIDVAVEAARRLGPALELHLHGAPDPSNRRAIPEATLREWSAAGLAHWHGPSADVRAALGAAHVALQPSRGGEGLPRSLLEGAALGRALVTTDVPGCRTFVRDGIEGLVVPPDDPAALAAALGRLAADPGLVARFGAAARARVASGGYAEADVMAAVSRVYAELLADLPADAPEA